MKLFKRALMALTIIIVLVMTVSSCTKKRYGIQNGTEHLIGMSQANLIEPWRIAMNEEIGQEAKKYEDIKIIYTNASQDTDKQIQDVENLMDYGIDLLMISPNDVDRLKPILRDIHKKIPIIVFDRAMSDEFDLYIGPDNDAIGHMAGQFVVDLLGEPGGTVLELKGLEGSYPSEERSKGFYEVLDKHPNIIVKDSINCDWLRDKAEDEMKYYFLRDEEMDVVFAHNDAMAYGAYKAANQLRVGKKIKYIGVDGLEGIDGGKNLVDRNILEGTFYYPTGGKLAVDYALQILLGTENIPKEIKLKPEIITNN